MEAELREALEKAVADLNRAIQAAAESGYGIDVNTDFLSDCVSGKVRTIVSLTVSRDIATIS